MPATTQASHASGGLHWSVSLIRLRAASHQAIVDAAPRPDTGTEGPATPQSSARSLDLSRPNIG